MDKKSNNGARALIAFGAGALMIGMAFDAYYDQNSTINQNYHPSAAYNDAHAGTYITPGSSLHKITRVLKAADLQDTYNLTHSTCMGDGEHELDSDIANNPLPSGYKQMNQTNRAYGEDTNFESPFYYTKVNNPTSKIHEYQTKGVLLSKLPKIKSLALDYDYVKVTYNNIKEGNEYTKNRLLYNLKTSISDFESTSAEKEGLYKYCDYFSPIDKYQADWAKKMNHGNNLQAVSDYMTKFGDSAQPSSSFKWYSYDINNQIPSLKHPNSNSIILQNSDLNNLLENKGYDAKAGKYVFKGSANGLLASQMFKYQSGNPIYKYVYNTNYFNAFIKNTSQNKYLPKFIPKVNNVVDNNFGNNLATNYLGKLNHTTAGLPLYIPALNDFGEDTLDQQAIDDIYNVYKQYHFNNSNIENLYANIHHPIQFYQVSSNGNREITYNNTETLTAMDLSNRITFCDAVLNCNHDIKFVNGHHLNDVIHDQAFWDGVVDYVNDYEKQCRKWQKLVQMTGVPITIQITGNANLDSDNLAHNANITKKAMCGNQILTYTEYGFKAARHQYFDTTYVANDNDYDYEHTSNESIYVKDQRKYDKLQQLIYKHPYKGKCLVNALQHNHSSVYNDIMSGDLYALPNAIHNYLTHWWRFW